MAIGDIGAALVDSLTLSTEGWGGGICHVSGDIYACVFRRSAPNDGVIHTFSVDENGDNITAIDNAIFEAVTCETPTIRKITGNVYVIPYQGPNNDGWLKTIEIATDGTIGSVLDSFEFDPTECWPRFGNWEKGNGDYYIFAYQGASGYLIIKSIQIDSAGSITGTADTLTYAVTQNKGIDLWNVGPNIFAVFIQQLVNASTIYTFSVSAAGQLTAIDSFAVAGANSAVKPRACHIHGEVYLLAHLGVITGNADMMSTIDISTSGQIGGIIDQLWFGGTNNIAWLEYCGNDGVGTGKVLKVDTNAARTYTVDDDGTIGALYDSLSLPGSSVVYAGLHLGPFPWTKYNYLVYIRQGPPTQDFFVETFNVGMASGGDRIYVWLNNIELTDPGYPTVLAARSSRGRDSELDQATSGIAELTLDNFNGEFSPENTSSPYYGELDLGAVIRFYEIYKGVQYWHFVGKIDKNTPKAELTDPTAYILAVDGMDDMAGTEIKTVLRIDTETGELAGDVLDAVNWPAADRDLDTGIDTLQIGWFHKVKGLDAIRLLEKTEDGRFYIDVDGIAIWENRHHRITGAGLTSQHDFEDTAVALEYELSKRLLFNEINVTGRRYYAGGVTLFSGYDMATLDDELVWSAHTGDVGAPYVPQGTTLTLWAEFNAPLASYDSLVAGTHWNANTSADKTGTNATANISLVQTQYGQAIKFEFTNNGGFGAYLVEPDSPPLGAPAARTVLVYGILYGIEPMAITESNTTSQDDYGKRSLDVTAPFMSNPNDVLAHAQYLLAKYEEPVPRAISIQHVARTAWPDDTLRIQCLVRKISDRITIKATRLNVDRDFYINKVIQDYVLFEGGMRHETTWVIERTLGNAEGLFWLLGVPDFGELGIATRVGR